MLRLRLAVPQEFSGRCLSDILAAAARLDPEAAARIVRFGAVRVDGQVERDPGRRISAGRRVFVLWSAQAAAQQPSPRLVYQDAHLWIVWKPAGIPVQGTRLGSENSVEEYLAASATKGLEPRIVHRLDLPVSGLMVAAATAEGAAGLSRGFEDGAVRKVYLAVAHVSPGSGSDLCRRLEGGDPVDIDHPLLWVSGKQKAMVSPDGKPARSRVALVAPPTDGRILLAIRLLSGRTHQIRVHLSHSGLPVVGDSAYGAESGSTEAPRIALHSTFLAFPHPVGKGPVVFQELPPDDFWKCARATPPADLLDRFRKVLGLLGCSD